MLLLKTVSLSVGLRDGKREHRELVKRRMGLEEAILITQVKRSRQGVGTRMFIPS